MECRAGGEMRVAIYFHVNADLTEKKMQFIHECLPLLSLMDFEPVADDWIKIMNESLQWKEQLTEKKRELLL